MHWIPLLFSFTPLACLCRPTCISVKRVRRRGGRRLIATAAAVQKALVRSQTEGLRSPLTNERSIIPSTLRPERFSDKRSCAFLLRGEFWPLLLTRIKPPPLCSRFAYDKVKLFTRKLLHTFELGRYVCCFRMYYISTSFLKCRILLNINYYTNWRIDLKQ